MKGIKNIQYQSGIGQVFRLEVLSGKFAGTHEIQEPDGFDALDISIDVNETYYNIDNFILGETSKIKILEYNDKEAFNIIKGVYDEQGGDGQIIFKWFIVRNGVEKDILGNGFEINLNKYQLNYENSQRVIECEIKKREAQNKFYTREDTTINLFATKNLDENQIDPIGSREIVLKAEVSELYSFWRMDDYGENYDWYNYKKSIGNKNLDPWFQYQKIVSNIKFIPPKTWVFPKFNRSEDSKLGENIPLYGGDWKANITREELQDPAWAAQYPRYMYEHGEITYWGQNTLFHTRNELSNVVFSISNLHFKARSYSIKKGYNPLYNGDNKGYRENYKPFSFSIALLIETPHGSNTIFLKSSRDTDIGNYSEMNIVNEGWAIGDLPANSTVKIGIMPHNDIRNKEFIITGKVSHTSLKISSSIDKLGRKSRVVSLFDAIDKVAENYSDGQIRLVSNILSDGGKYANQYVATGAFLRGVANIFLGENKINTSFKSLFYEGAAPLLALGFDVIENKLIVEDIDYFFKDVQAYDLTGKDFVQENLTIENDKDISYNNLIFGTKKYSTKKKGDIFNFNTKMECSTPIKSVKKKLDKTTGFIIDEYKIQDLLDDTNDNTNDNDDDLVLIDTITGSYVDTGSYPDIIHSDSGGVLTLTASKSPWDTLPFRVGEKIKIVEGLNVGEYTILAIKSHTLTLDKRTGIEQGTILTKIEHTLTDVIKNRNATATDGFISAEGVKNKRTAVNLYHNPKYQMKRWFPLFGGGLSKKPNGENIIVTNYKNNGKIEVEPDTDKIPHLPSEVDVLNENINLERLRRSSRVLFGTENIEITLTNVTFEEFYNLYNRWRIGEDIYTGEKIPSRGYIDVYISGETYSIYPFGTEALQYDKGANELTIKGKIKNSKWGRKIFDKTFDDTFE